MPDEVVCMCSKGDTLDAIQRDIRDLKKSNQEIREKLFNGLSTEVPLLRKAIEKLKDNAVPEIHSDSNRRPKIPRIVGTIIIVCAFGLIMILGLIFMLVTNIITLEDVGKMLGAILERL